MPDLFMAKCSWVAHVDFPLKDLKLSALTGRFVSKLRSMNLIISFSVRPTHTLLKCARTFGTRSLSNSEFTNVIVYCCS